MIEELNSSHFGAFFHELWNYDPFPWQERLAALVCEGEWPESLDLPTASGKTAFIDIAVFAMAVRGEGPRRIFFVVDRRVIVDAAFDRMKKIADKLRKGGGNVVPMVARRLREMGQSKTPLDAYQLRGGIYRDDSWVRTPLQPTAVASTVDQVGSRLLFRGYGVWDKTLPIHASLIANDALIFLDEAHCSRAFSETLRAIRRYRGSKWGGESFATPFAFVEMTATPRHNAERAFALEHADYQHPEMRKRLFALKPARLMVSKARAKDFQKLAEALVDEAVRLAKEPGLRRIAVMVNRVRTARLAYAALKKLDRRVRLVIGRMRPVDRAELGDLDALLSGQPRRADGGPFFVVATQCLEVGADLDFDAVVTECASIDALVQRFGRLDRIGDLWKSGVKAQGCVVITSPMTDPKYRDPIYGEALGRTWRWLQGVGDPVDFGICSEDGDITVRERLKLAGEAVCDMRRESPPAPVLLPSHLDALVQTFPRPELEPDVSLFLHGKEDGSPEVQVVWRADLDLLAPKQWPEIVALCPPVSAEAMPVPLRDFRAWLSGSDDAGSVSSDIEGADEGAPGAEDQLRCPVLLWRGDNSKLVDEPQEIRRIRPGDTLVLAAGSEGWDELGHIPPGARIDVAERARLDLRRGWILRLHPALIELWPEKDARERVAELARDPAPERKKEDVVEALRTYGKELNEDAPDWLRRMLDADKMPKKLEPEAYPSDGETHSGWVLVGRFIEADSGQDESSASTPIPLGEHLEHVTGVLLGTTSTLVADASLRQSLERASRFHDCGKADPRFQALLRGGDPMAAQFAPRLLAKGEVARQSPKLRQAQWRQSGLPDGFRHELVSLLLAGQDLDVAADDLALHLIASHHGRCRPFAPVVEDDGPDFAYGGRHVTRDQRREQAAHRLDSGVAERYWKLTRRYGWWGLAYLESLLRLADWEASRREAESKEDRP